MNILILTYEIKGRGGNYIRCYSLGLKLSKMGHQVTIIASPESVRLYSKISHIDNLTIIETADFFPEKIRHDGFSPIDLMERIYHVIVHRYDIVHAFGHRPTVAIPALLHRMVHGKPYIADWSDLWGEGGIAEERKNIIGKLIGWFDQQTECRVYKQASAITVISHYLKQKALTLGIQSKAVFLVPVGSSHDTIKSLSQRYSRSLLSIPQNIFLVLFSGVANYDQILLANTFVELTFLNKNVRLLFLGSYMPLFWNKLHQSHKEHLVLYEKFVPHEKLGLYLSCADIFLLPYTNREINRARLPNKIGDYLAAGRPTVTNPTGDLEELFKQHSIGILASENPKKFATEINKLLQQKEKRKEMGRKAREISCSVLSWEKLAKQLDQFYTAVYDDNKNKKLKTFEYSE